MHFPIHGYPNDYWRFTPEAFRALGAEFPSVAIFYSGSPVFPYTVCGVAAKSQYDREPIRTLARSGKIRTTAPLIIERYAAVTSASYRNRRSLRPDRRRGLAFVYLSVSARPDRSALRR